MPPTFLLRSLAATGAVGVLVLATSAFSAGLGGPRDVGARAFDAASATTTPITISFAGDVHFEAQLGSVAKDPDGLSALTPYLAAADVTIVNLETAVATGGRRMAGKQFTFRTPPSALTTLANAGVDMVSLANNHAADFGKAGLAETLAARDGSPVRLLGIGDDAAEAFTPAVVEVRGTTIAVLAASQLRDHTTVYFAAGDGKPGIASMEDPTRLLDAVRAASATYDIVVVVPHWGVEKDTCPSAKQSDAARRLAEAGADIVVGSHTHRVMGSGLLGRTYVGYGLGNFVWFRNATFPGRSTGVLTVEVDPARIGTEEPAVTGESWQPLSITESGIPAPDPETAEQMLADRAQAVECSGLEPVSP